MIPDHVTVTWGLYVVLAGFLFGCGFALASHLISRLLTRTAPTRTV